MNPNMEKQSRDHVRDEIKTMLIKGVPGSWNSHPAKAISWLDLSYEEHIIIADYIEMQQLYTIVQFTLQTLNLPFISSVSISMPLPIPMMK